MQHDPTTASRRRVIQAGGLGLAAAVVPGAVLGTPAAGHTEPPADLITRPIPRTGQRLPVLGLGTFLTFDTLPGAPRAHLLEVARRHWSGGGRVFDVSALYGRAEENLGDFLATLRINNAAFIADKVWSTGEYLWDDSHAEQSRRRSARRLHRTTPFDVLQCHSLTNADVVVPLLHAWKREGRTRYIGVTHHEPAAFGNLARWVEVGDLDFVQVHYSIFNRTAEERVLPAAADRGTAVLVNMPLEKARLHQVVQGHPLPAFAADLGIRSWAQYFLKWVIGHPAVTCVLAATSNPDHLVDNHGAMRGPVPDQAMRERMRAHLESIPGFDRIAQTPWYPGKSYRGAVTAAQAALRARSPWWASGPPPA